MHSTLFFFFFFNDTATTEIYTLSLHDALPIYIEVVELPLAMSDAELENLVEALVFAADRSEEHTSELQSQSNLVCRLLLEKKKKTEISPLSNSHQRLDYQSCALII